MPRLNTNKYHDVHLLTVDEVVDLNTLIDFLNSRVGAPLPTVRDKGAVSKQAQSFFESYPDASWRALTDLATWARVKRKHLSMVQLVGSWRYAYQDGFMQILERGGSTNDDETLHVLLKGVDDPHVRETMSNALTKKARDEIYNAYLATRPESEVAVEEPSSDPVQEYGLSTGQVVKVRFNAADELTLGTIVGLSGDSPPRPLVYMRGESLPVDWESVYVRNDGAWECLI